MKKNSNNPFLSSIESNTGHSAVAATKLGVYSKTLLGIIVFIASLAITISNQVLLMLSVNIFVIILSIGALFAITVGVVKNPQKAGIYALLYSALEGFLLAGITALVMVQVGNLTPVYALLMIVCIFIFMYAFYALVPRSVSKAISSIVTVLLIAFVAITLVMSIMSIFIGMSNPTYLAISIAGAVLASFMFIRDFQNVDYVVENGLSKEYEWVCALGIISTVIMLFIYILRIFLALSRR